MAYNVLLIDDSNIVRKVLMKTFGMTGIPVGQFLEAENGKVALELLKQNWVDLVFLDINMPVMNGIDFMRAFTQEQDFKDIPVIVVSTEGSKERREELDNAGVKAYLRKPVAPEVLVETINAIMSGKANGK